MPEVMEGLSRSNDVPFSSDFEKVMENTTHVMLACREHQVVSHDKEGQVGKSGRKLSSFDAVDEEDEHDEKGFKDIVLGPQVPLEKQLEMDKDDESLMRWKEQLLGNVDVSAFRGQAEPEVCIQSLTIMSPGRSDLVLPIPLIFKVKGSAFTLKDGSKYRIRFAFLVSNNLVSGLKYTNTVWKTGVRVESTKVMLGTFSPQKEPYTCELEEETTPSGLLSRGSYSARSKFVDDDGKCYLDLHYSFQIRKDWPANA